MPDPVNVAKIRLAANELRSSELTAELERLSADTTQLRDFVKMARRLSEETGADACNDNDPPAPTGPASAVTVRRKSFVGRVAVLIRDHGPMTIADLTTRIIADGHGQGEDATKFQTTLNSAIWRRKTDLFEKQGETIVLQTKDFQLVEG